MGCGFGVWCPRILPEVIDKVGYDPTPLTVQLSVDGGPSRKRKRQTVSATRKGKFFTGNLRMGSEKEEPIQFTVEEVFQTRQVGSGIRREGRDSGVDTVTMMKDIRVIVKTSEDTHSVEDLAGISRTPV